ncbi:MAG TPA: hypothetical protein VF261_01530, partial [Candidatus Saccharimonadales bacterium]
DEIRYVADLALGVWEHPALQGHINPAAVAQVVTSGFQRIGDTDTALTFTVPDSYYPSIEIKTRQESRIPPNDDALTQATDYLFTRGRPFFGKRSYRAWVWSDELSIEDDELPTDEESEIPLPKAESWLNPRQLRAIARGRRQPGSQPISQYQIVRLAYLLDTFNPATLLDVANETFKGFGD